MGNQQTRKRHGEEELAEVEPKRARIDYGDSDSFVQKRRKLSSEKGLQDGSSPIAKRRRLSKLLRLSSVKLDSLLRSETGSNLAKKERCCSLDGHQQRVNACGASFASDSIHPLLLRGCNDNMCWIFPTAPNCSNWKSSPLDSGFPRRASSHHLHRATTPKGSCSNIHRKEFPVPWLEALFLPEFPSRSAINEKNFTITNEIGNGSFGRVYRVVTKNDTRGIYALKIQQKSLVLRKKAVLQVRREVAVQRLLSPHIFIVRFYAAWQTRSKLFTVLQYPVGGIGDMFTLWQEHGVLPEPTIRIYGSEIACALDFLHRSNVIYRDLKLENIVLDSVGHIRVADFGLSKHLSKGEQTNTICGTLQYMSPDVASEKPYSHYIDWWSLAVVLHILATGKYPYPNANAVHHRHLRFVDYSTPIGCSETLGNLFDQMLAYPDIVRLRSFEALKEHEFFRRIDFNDVEALKHNPLADLLKKEQQMETTEAIEWDGDEEVEGFCEKYEFDGFNYFNDNF